MTRAKKKNFVMRRHAYIAAGIMVLLVFADVPLFAAGGAVKEMKINTLSIPPQGLERLKTKRIISKEKIIINGTLLLDGAGADPKKPFEIRAENGDIEINGEIKIVPPPKKKSAWLWMHEHLFQSVWAFAAPVPPTPINISASRYTPSDRGWIITADRGNIILGPHAKISTLSGGNGHTVRANGSPFGTDGEDGGDIVFNAPNGQVEVQWNSFLPDVKEWLHGPAGNSPLFELGNGGNGGDVVVDDRDAERSAKKLIFKAGNGGRSGKISIHASRTPPIVFYAVGPAGTQKVGPLDLRAAGLPTNMIAGGRGGNGGNAEWRINHDNPKFTALESIGMVGGYGGDGVVLGGNGGRAIYLSLSIINHPMKAKKAAMASVFGGKGGDTLFSYLPIPGARAGDGGVAVVAGNRGWDGLAAPGDPKKRDGAGGGDIDIVEGRGGSIFGFGGRNEWDLVSDWLGSAPYRIAVPEDFLRIFSPAGRGGDGAPQEPPTQYAPLLAMAGGGGDGGNGCKNPSPSRRSGGRGGRGGKNVAAIKGGNGGYGVVGGNGGNIYGIGSATGGNGGNGTPPGKGGQSGDIPDEIVPGEAGDGIQPGKRGDIANGGIIGNPVDGVEGKECGDEPKKPAPPPSEESPADICTIPKNHDAEHYWETKTTYQLIEPEFADQLPHDSVNIVTIKYDAACDEAHLRGEQICVIATLHASRNGVASAVQPDTFRPQGVGGGGCDKDGHLYMPGETTTAIQESITKGFADKPLYKVIETIKSYCKNCGEGGDGYSKALFAGASCKKDAGGRYQLVLPNRISIFPFRGPGTSIPRECYCRVKPKTLKEDCKIRLKDLPGDCKLPLGSLPPECRKGDARTLPATCTVDTNDLPDTCKLSPSRLPAPCQADLNYLPSECTKFLTDG